MRDRLVEHAEDVFRRKGFHAASVQDLTRAAGVPKGSFYNHFAHKQDLAVEVVHRYVGATDVSDLDGDGPVLERLRRHLNRQNERIAATGVEFGCLLGTFADDGTAAGERVREAVREALAVRTGALAAAIEAGQAAGEVTGRRPAAALAAFLIDVLEGATLRAKARGDQSSLAEEIDIALDALRT
ncbi:TetR/AcrR family transcriptional regulator [Streptomyces sp. NPDC015220]|uniref:TetR/AcrR family transcriptional regulator n=1 Tax=Streptomyces sp. NPDC015220 TaxID=3364947 RepID=UPI0036FEB9C4